MLSAQSPKRNVIIFVADGLRRGSVTAADMPTFLKLRSEGVDFRNSHSVFPTFTTANASAIATGHALGDTGDFSNVIYPGMWLAQQNTPTANGSITPFLENDAILADLNSHYDNNYLGEPTLLSTARAHGFNVASIGKLGPTAIQQVDVLSRNQLGLIQDDDAIIIDDTTGNPAGIPLPIDLSTAIDKAGLALDAPLRTNGYAENSFWNNGNAGNASIPGTRTANITQQQWFADVTTQVLLPRFAAQPKPFVLLFWSRDPDGTQHNQGDSLQNLAPGINGDASHLALRNADHNLKQILDWLEAHPAVKANTDVFITSDHGFATISRREINPANDTTTEPSAALPYNVGPHEAAQPPGTLPSGFLAIDLALWSHSRLFDPMVRSDSGDSIYKEVVLSGEKADHPSNGNGLISEHSIKQLDGTDARLIVAANGGSDLIYVPSHDPAIVRSTLEILRSLDYVGGLFVDDSFCPAPTDCPGALRLSDIALKGSTKLPRPAIVVAFKVFYRTPGDLQSGVQISDTTLQEGQGMHGGLGRESTWNNMAATGPDFKHGFVDELPMGNIDIVPTLASILGLDLASHGDLRGRVLAESLVTNATTPTSTHGVAVSAPDSSGARTVLEYQESNGVRYYDRGCFLTSSKAPNSCAP
jgi:predicted AlkP superfamily pyrophosphatase or phosphodiesterase